LHFTKIFNNNILFQKDNSSPKKCIIADTCTLFKDAIGKLENYCNPIPCSTIVRSIGIAQGQAAGLEPLHFYFRGG